MPEVFEYPLLFTGAENTGVFQDMAQTKNDVANSNQMPITSVTAVASELSLRKGFAPATALDDLNEGVLHFFNIHVLRAFNTNVLLFCTQ